MVTLDFVVYHGEFRLGGSISIADQRRAEGRLNTEATRPEITQIRRHRLPVRPRSYRLWRRCRQIVLVALIAVGQFGRIELTAEETTGTTWLTGARFQKELEQPFLANWTLADLRQIARDITNDRRISIVLDRRLDPSTPFPFDAKNASLKTGIDELAAIAKGRVCIIDNVVYLGPDSAAGRLRTLIELRKLELQSKEAGIPDRRRSELLRRRNVSWGDLETPREILDGISNSSRLKIANADLIPHDLWARATLPETTLPEALSVILIQFDLTFRWTDSGASIEIIPIPEHLLVERKHHSKLKPAAAIALIRQKFPDLDVKLSQSEIIVNGTVEDHEAVASLLRGDKPASSAKVEQSHPVRQRLFTLSVEQPVPLIALLKKLEESDIHFEYNAEELKAAGIDLEQMLQLDVKNMPAPEFFKTVFDPARLDFQIDRQTVKLKPKKSATSKQ